MYSMNRVSELGQIRRGTYVWRCIESCGGYFSSLLACYVTGSHFENSIIDG
jgi:hypothetical protein